MILSNFLRTPSWLRPVKRVKGVCLLGCVWGEACSPSLLRTIGDDFTELLCDSPYRVDSPYGVCLKNLLWLYRVHFPLRLPNAVFFYHGTSQYDFMWTALSEPHNKGFWIMEMCCLGTKTAAMLLSRMHLYQSDKLNPKCSAWQQLGQNI